MYKYSTQSEEKLKMCDSKIQKVMKKVIKIYDVSIIYGHRCSTQQFELYKKGRIEKKYNVKENYWKIVDKDKILTNCDGYDVKSKHNVKPSLAIDVAPYPLDWNNEYRFYYMAGLIQGVAFSMKINLKWGGKFMKLKDLCHFEIDEG